MVSTLDSDPEPVRLVADESCDFHVIAMESKLALEARRALLAETQAAHA